MRVSQKVRKSGFAPRRKGDGGTAAKSAKSFRNVAFSGGQRNCVGQRFAMIESTVLLVLLMRALKFELTEESAEVHPVSSGVVQKPRAGELWLRVSAR